MPSLLAWLVALGVLRRCGIRVASSRNGHEGKIIKRTVAPRYYRLEGRGTFSLQKHFLPAFFISSDKSLLFHAYLCDRFIGDTSRVLTLSRVIFNGQRYF